MIKTRKPEIKTYFSTYIDLATAQVTANQQTVQYIIHSENK